MLFDLRGKGRRRTVQVIYLGLAILMGGGLVLFGIGGATSGGLIDAINGKSGNSSSSSDIYKTRITSYTKQVRADPKDAKAWAGLTRAQVQQASITGYNGQTGTYSADGLQQLQTAADSWQKYLALNPKKPDGNLASLMVTAYGASALNDLGKSAEALTVVIDQRGGSSALYSQLAVLYYAAGNVRQSVLAEKDAVARATPAQRNLVKARIAAQRKSIDKSKLSSAVQQGAAQQGLGN
jgi:hypothetical protein